MMMNDIPSEPHPDISNFSYRQAHAHSIKQTSISVYETTSSKLRAPISSETTYTLFQIPSRLLRKRRPVFITRTCQSISIHIAHFTPVRPYRIIKLARLANLPLDRRQINTYLLVNTASLAVKRTWYRNSVTQTRPLHIRALPGADVVTGVWNNLATDCGTSKGVLGRYFDPVLWSVAFRNV